MRRGHSQKPSCDASDRGRAGQSKNRQRAIEKNAQSQEALQAPNLPAGVDKTTQTRAGLHTPALAADPSHNPTLIRARRITISMANACTAEADVMVSASYPLRLTAIQTRTRKPWPAMKNSYGRRLSGRNALPSSHKSPSPTLPAESPAGQSDRNGSLKPSVILAARYASLAAGLGLSIDNMDVVTAFLNPEVDDPDLYMAILESQHTNAFTPICRYLSGVPSNCVLCSAWQRNPASRAHAEAEGSESDGGNCKRAGSSHLLLLQWCRSSQQQQEMPGFAGPSRLISLGWICKKV